MICRTITPQIGHVARLENPKNGVKKPLNEGTRAQKFVIISLVYLPLEQRRAITPLDFLTKRDAIKQVYTN